MTTPDAPGFGDLVRRYRRDAGMTQDELAAAVGLTWRELNAIERGEGDPPSADLATRLAGALRLSTSDRAALRAASAHLAPNSSQAPASDPQLAAQNIPPSAMPRRQHLPVGGYLGTLPDGPLVGREAETQRLLALVQAVEAGEGRLVLLAGEPGIGKTRLAQEVTRDVYERGFLIASGRCYEPQSAVAYYPFLEVLANVYAAAPESLQAQVPHRWAELARLLPDQAPGGAPSSAASSGRDDQQRLFWQVSSFLQALIAVQPVAVLLDDLQWADAASLDLVQHLARQTHGQQILLLGTYRDVEVGQQHPLETALRDLAREHLLERLPVRRLSAEDTRALIAATLGAEQVSDELTQALYSRTEGNPFFTCEVMSALVERGDVYKQAGGWGRKAIEELEIPESVRSVLGQRISRLDAPTQEVLREASVLGQTFAFDELRSMGARDEAEMETALQEAVATGLVREAGGDAYGFSHALIQQTLYQELPARKRRRLHRAAGEALEQLAGARRAGRAAELAWHFLEADEGVRALPYSIQAGDAAEAVYAHAEAEKHYRTALELAGEAGDQPREAEALEKLAHLLHTLSRYEEARSGYEGAARRYHDLGDQAGELRTWALMLDVCSDEDLGRILPLVQRVEADGSASTELAAVYNGLAQLYFSANRLVEGRSAAARAEEIARALGAEAQLAEALMWKALADEALGVDVLQERMAMIPLAERVGDLFVLAMVLLGVAFSYRDKHGDFADAQVYLARALDTAQRRGGPNVILLALAAWMETDFFMGEWDRVEERGRQASALLQQASTGDIPWHWYFVLIALGRLDLARGRLQQAEERLKQVDAVLGRLDLKRNVHELLAERDLITGRPADALARLEPLLDRPGMQEGDVEPLLDRPGMQEGDVEPLLPRVGWAQLALNRDDDAAATLAACRARCGRLWLVDALRVEALLAIKQQRWQDAVASLEEALTMCRALPYPYAEAKALYVYGQLHAAKGEPEQARVKYEAALAICDRLGEGLYRPRIAQALAALPAAVPAREETNDGQ